MIADHRFGKIEGPRNWVLPLAGKLVLILGIEVGDAWGQADVAKGVQTSIKTIDYLQELQAAIFDTTQLFTISCVQAAGIRIPLDSD